MRDFLNNEDGTTVVEYAVIAGLIFLAIVSAIQPIGGSLSGMFADAEAGLNN
jgi:Flp pilus assembly pilin Flp